VWHFLLQPQLIIPDPFIHDFSSARREAASAQKQKVLESKQVNQDLTKKQAEPIKHEHRR
jgi:hypothetical protein